MNTKFNLNTLKQQFICRSHTQLVVYTLYLYTYIHTHVPVYRIYIQYSYFNEYHRFIIRFNLA